MANLILSRIKKTYDAKQVLHGIDVTIPDDPPERGIRRSRFMEYGPMEAVPAMPFNVPVPPPDGGAITIALPDDEPV